MSDLTKFLPLIFLLSRLLSGASVQSFCITAEFKSQNIQCVSKESSNRNRSARGNRYIKDSAFVGHKKRYGNHCGVTTVIQPFQRDLTRTAASIEHYGTDVMTRSSPFTAAAHLANNILKVGMKTTPLFTILALILKASTSEALRQGVNAFFVKSPYKAAFIICALKASLADLLVQQKTSKEKMVAVNANGSSSHFKSSSITLKNDKRNIVYGGAIMNKKPPFEFKRNLAFFFYGGAYQGCVQEHIFNHIYPALFGSATDIFTVSTKVIVDMLFTAPFLCLPTAYVIKGAIYQNSVMHSLQHYVHDIQVNDLLRKMWCVWAPAQFITFSWIPQQYRISFIAFIGFFWLLILSSISGKKRD